MRNWQDCSPEEIRISDTIHLLLSVYPKLEAWLFQPHQPRLNAPAAKILARIGKFSTEVQILIRVTLDLWSGEGHTQLNQILNKLDTRNLINVLAAILYLKLPELDSQTQEHIREMIYSS